MHAPGVVCAVPRVSGKQLDTCQVGRVALDDLQVVSAEQWWGVRRNRVRKAAWNGWLAAAHRRPLWRQASAAIDAPHLLPHAVHVDAQRHLAAVGAPCLVALPAGRGRTSMARI